MTQVPTFLKYGEKVLAQREEDGIRGIDREYSRWRCHLSTAPFADKSLDEVTSKDIREWLREMSKKRAKGPGKTRTLSRQTVHRAQTLVSTIFGHAVEHEVIEQNPCAGVRMKKAVDERDTEEKWAYLTIDEQRAITACEEIPLPDRLAIRFSFLTGLRQGEFRHLETKDVHLDDENPHVVVRYAGISKKGKKLPPKSGKVRKVPLIAEAQAVCREWLEILPTYAPNNPNGLMWPTPSGRYRQQGKPLGKSDTLKKWYVAAGIELRPHLHWHALRHTCASSLLSGVWGRAWPIEQVQVVMGHSSVTITQRYAHLGEDTIAQAAKETVIVQPPPEEPSPVEEPKDTSLVQSVKDVVGRAFDFLRRSA